MPVSRAQKLLERIGNAWKIEQQYNEKTVKDWKAQHPEQTRRAKQAQADYKREKATTATKARRSMQPTLTRLRKRKNGLK